ncbi:TIGR03915 family putative DNA repair protein [Chitinophaga agrisoli]|nr:TIGR03915 family putative DNA repair protein [Chitinophaga agrisoli]
MMQTVLYDASFEGFFTAVFEIYEYRISQPDIQREGAAAVSLFGNTHTVHTDRNKAGRVIKKLQEKLYEDAFRQLYWSFLSAQPGIENTLFRYTRYALSSSQQITTDYSNADVLTIQQTAKKMGREKHRMEAFIRFQQTKDGLYYAVVSPDFNVLPLISRHFEERYADQRWLIYDTTRKYGIFYDLNTVSEVSIDFTTSPQDTAAIYDEKEALYQSLWQTYFNSTNITARKNMPLHIRHMPRRYWKYLTEKKPY